MSILKTFVAKSISLFHLGNTWTTVVVCKNVGKNKKGEPYDWFFATSLKPSRGLVKQYRKRWNIETGFRVMEEGKLKTKSNNPLVRFFYFLLRALLTLLWVLSNLIRAYRTYKSYLRTVERELRKKRFTSLHRYLSFISGKAC